MQSKVNILADDMGNVVRQSSTNSEFGHVRLQQTRVTFGNGGWVKKSNISTLLHGKLEDLQELGLESMDSLPGKIVIKEQLEPFSKTDPDRDYKKAGETGIICCVDGQPIYRKTFFVADTTAEDVLIAHNNGQAIKDANSLEKATVADNNTSAAEAFGFEDPKDEEDEVVTTDTTEEVADEVEEQTEDEVLVEETFEL
jgi:hypothetical protein|tara:strand:+ start:1588 stop:2181 length:594 start_codon:yes stop_codon:yes gene_type:complete